MADGNTCLPYYSLPVEEVKPLWTCSKSWVLPAAKIAPCLSRCCCTEGSGESCQSSAKGPQANCCADHCSPYSASHSHICSVCIRWCCDRFRPKWIYAQLQSCTRLPSCSHLHRHSGILLCVVLKNTKPTVMYWRLFNSVLGVLKECKLRWHFGSGSVGMNAELLLFFQAFWFVFCPPA